MIFPLNYCFQADVIVFLLEKILVERFNSADQIDLVVTWTDNCTCHHLTKNICFLSEMWNLRQIRDLAIANVARFASLNAVFLSWEKNTTSWLYVTLTGHIYNHTTYFGKIENLRSEPKHMALVFNDFAPKLLFPIRCYGFFVGKNELIQGTIN